MNAADAKAPKFDSKWWKANKAKLADMSGAFENALKKYETEKKSFLQSGSGGDRVTKALADVKAQAAKTRSDAKLTALQKETKEALGNYEKQCDVAIAEYKKLIASPLMTMSSTGLIKSPVAKQFEDFCKKRHVDENFNFLNLMAKKPKLERRWYDEFIKQGAKFELNIPSGMRGDFDKIAAAIQSDPAKTPDTPATWSKAPWDAVVKEIAGLLNKDVVPGFRAAMAGQQMKSKLP